MMRFLAPLRALTPVRAALVLALLCACCRGGGGGGGGGSGRGPGPGVAVASSLPGSRGVRWQWRAPAPSSVGMPGSDGQEVAFTYGRGHLVVLRADGTARWDSARTGLREVAPTLTEDLVLAATDEGVAAFRRTDGSLAWDTHLPARANTPVGVGAVVVTSTWEGELVGLTRASGTPAWRVTLGGSAIGPPAATGDGGVLVTWEKEHAAAGGVVAVDAATGRQRWAAAAPPGGISAPVVTPGGCVVAVAGDLAAHGWAVTTGEERWRTRLDGAGSPEVPAVAVGPDQVLTAHRLGGLDLLDAATGQRRWQVRTGGAAIRGGPAIGPAGTFALPLDDGSLLVAGPARAAELRQAPSRISGVVGGPDGLLVATTRGGATNTAEATTAW